MGAYVSSFSKCSGFEIGRLAPYKVLGALKGKLAG